MVAQIFDLSTKAGNKDSYVKSCFDADNKFSILKHICMHQTKHVYSQSVACGLVGTHTMKKIIYRNNLKKKKKRKNFTLIPSLNDKSQG